MLKRICLATTMVAALAFASLITADTAEAGGCRRGGYYSGYRSHGLYGGGFYPYHRSFHRGFYGGYSPYYYVPRRHRGLHFSIGF